MTDAFVLNDLRVRAGATQLVHGVCLSVAPGESVALLGHSGSGKSLTAAAVCGSLSRLLDATGHLMIGGHRVDVTSTKRPAGHIAWVQQDSSSALNPLVRVGDQLEIPLRRIGALPGAARQRVLGLLDACGIEDPARVLRSYPAELSGGQRQRVCIALALACEARILIADEPTTALDVVSQAQVLSTLTTARECTELTLLFITHDIAVASQICDRAVVLQDGRVVEQGSLDDLINDPGHSYTRELVAAASEAELCCASSSQDVA